MNDEQNINTGMQETVGIAEEPSTEGQAAPDGPEKKDDGTPEQQEGIAEEPAGENEAEVGNTEENAEPDYELSVSEDFPMPEENLRSFTDACRKAGLTREQAEAVLDWHKGQFREDAVWREQQEKQARAAWDKEILEDKDFGCDRTNYKATVAAARKALGVVDPGGELRSLLRDTQGQYHPAVVRALARVGRMMGEHGFVGQNGEGGSRTDKPLWERMYGAGEQPGNV